MLRQRLISGTLLAVAPLVCAMYLPSVLILAVIIAITLLGLLEFYAMLDRAGVPSFRVLGSLLGAVLVAGAWVAENVPTHWTGPWRTIAQDLDDFMMFVVVLVICIRQFPQKDNTQPLPTIACTLLGILYIPFLLNFFTRLIYEWAPVAVWAPMDRTGMMLVLYLIAVVKSSDIGAFFVGSRFGRHKLFPRISPGKTWEGLAGGLAASTVVSLLFWHGLTWGGPLSATALFGPLSLHFHDAVILGLLLGGVGVIGDLVESLLKRAATMKDSSERVPGMGGVLDVIDSLLFSAPVLYYYTRWFMA